MQRWTGQRMIDRRYVSWNTPVEMSRPVFDVHYADGRRKLVMEADLHQGWTKLQKTYGFFRQTRIPYRNDLSIRAQLSLIAQPASFGVWAQTFPSTNAEFGDDDLSYHLHEERLIVRVALRPGQPWRTTKTGRPELYIEQLPFLNTDHSHWYDLRGWIVFHEGSPRRIPDVRVWAENNLVVSGGQFESDRRRH